MKITILQIGKTKHRFVQEAEEEYLKRLQPYAKIQTITIKESELSHGDVQAGREKVKSQEAQQLLKHVSSQSYLIALTEKGKSMTSLQFADFLRKKRDLEGADVTFIIGGPYGLAPEILQRTNLQLSFSAFTFTHEIIRVLLLEQVYRAFMILKGKTYHYE